MELFEIPVVYKGKKLHFNAELLTYAYSYKIQVEVNGVLVLFEPDEERNYRAVLQDSQRDNSKADKELIKCIADAIENILK